MVFSTVVAFVVALALPAGAVVRGPGSAEQTGKCDPAYGCPPGTPPPPPAPSCSLSVAVAAPGATVTASVDNAGGAVTVRITFDGDEVGRGTTAADGSGRIQWQVPRVASGQHQVFAVGADFNVQCGPFEVSGGVQVAGESFTRAQGGAVSGRGGGSLARTGMRVALLVAVALVLVVVGWQLLRAGGRWRRRTLRRRNEVRDLTRL